MKKDVFKKNEKGRASRALKSNKAKTIVIIILLLAVAFFSMKMISSKGKAAEDKVEIAVVEAPRGSEGVAPEDTEMKLGKTVVGKKIIKADLENDMILYNDLSDKEKDIGDKILNKFLQYPVRSGMPLYADMVRPESISEFDYLNTMPENYLPLVLSYEGIDLVGNEVKPGDRVRVTLIGEPEEESNGGRTSSGRTTGYSTSTTATESDSEAESEFTLGEDEEAKQSEDADNKTRTKDEDTLFNPDSDEVKNSAKKVEVVELFSSVLVDDLLNQNEESVRQIFKETLLLPEAQRQILYKTPEFKQKIKGNYIVLLVSEDQFDQYLKVTKGASNYELKLALRSRKNSETIVDMFNTLPAELQSIIEENSSTYNKGGGDQ